MWIGMGFEILAKPFLANKSQRFRYRDHTPNLMTGVGCNLSWYDLNHSTSVPGDKARP